MASGTLARLRTRGFDNSRHIPFTKYCRAGCSQCEVLVINGVPCHETGCPHATATCHGCNATVPARVRYCEDCQ